MMPIRDPDPSELWNVYRNAAARERELDQLRRERIESERQLAQRIYDIRKENERRNQRHDENK